MKNPGEMTFKTLIWYYYNRPQNHRNWVFPITIDDLRLRENGDAHPIVENAPMEVQT